MSSGRRRSGGSESALPQSEWWIGVQDEVEDKQYIRRQRWASRQSLQQARLPQTTAQELLRVVDKTQQLLIRRPNVLKEHYHQTSMDMQKSIDARGVYVCVTVHVGNLVRLDKLEGLQNDKSKLPPKRVWGDTYSVIGEGNCVEKVDELPPA